MTTNNEKELEQKQQKIAEERAKKQAIKERNDAEKQAKLEQIQKERKEQAQKNKAEIEKNKEATIQKTQLFRAKNTQQRNEASQKEMQNRGVNERDVNYKRGVNGARTYNENNILTNSLRLSPKPVIIPQKPAPQPVPPLRPAPQVRPAPEQRSEPVSAPQVRPAPQARPLDVKPLIQSYEVFQDAQQKYSTALEIVKSKTNTLKDLKQQFEIKKVELENLNKESVTGKNLFEIEAINKKGNNLEQEIRNIENQRTQVKNERTKAFDNSINMLTPMEYNIENMKNFLKQHPEDQVRLAVTNLKEDFESIQVASNTKLNTNFIDTKRHEPEDLRFIPKKGVEMVKTLAQDFINTNESGKIIEIQNPKPTPDPNPTPQPKLSVTQNVKNTNESGKIIEIQNPKPTPDPNPTPDPIKPKTSEVSTQTETEGDTTEPESITKLSDKIEEVFDEFDGEEVTGKTIIKAAIKVLPTALKAVPEMLKLIKGHEREDPIKNFGYQSPAINVQNDKSNNVGSVASNQFKVTNGDKYASTIKDNKFQFDTTKDNAPTFSINEIKTTDFSQSIQNANYNNTVSVGEKSSVEQEFNTKKGNITRNFTVGQGETVSVDNANGNSFKFVHKDDKTVLPVLKVGNDEIEFSKENLDKFLETHKKNFPKENLEFDVDGAKLSIKNGKLYKGGLDGPSQEMTEQEKNNLFKTQNDNIAQTDQERPSQPIKEQPANDVSKNSNKEVATEVSKEVNKLDPKAQDAATHLLNALMDDKALDVAKSEVSQSQNTNKAQEGGATR